MKRSSRTIGGTSSAPCWGQCPDILQTLNKRVIQADKLTEYRALEPLLLFSLVLAKVKAVETNNNNTTF